MRTESKGAVADSLIEHILLAQLDWAIAGTSSSTAGEDGTRHSKWEHWIDSRTNEPENATDEGDMYPQSDNKTLEKGKMINPATGKETEYEEVWHDVDPVSTNAGGKIKSFVLQFDNEAGLRGSIVRHGHFVQGFLKEGERLTAERWEWKEEGKWGRLLKLGTEELPSMIVMDVLDHLDDEMHLRLGDAVKLGGRSWRVVELS